MGRRHLAVLALGLLVTAAHLGLGHWWSQQRLGWGQGDQPLKTMDVRFVQALLPSPPPARPRPPPKLHRPPAAPRAVADNAQSAPEPAPPPAASQAAAAASAPTEPPALESAALDQPVDTPIPAGPASPQAGPALEWPPSTQLRYDLSGHYRGPVNGWAEVKWLLLGQHYQVDLEFRVPPWGGRRILSDGLIGPEGLSPRRYDQETDLLLRSTVRETLWFEGGSVQLANGRRVSPTQPATGANMAGEGRGPPGTPVSRLTGLQDTASQFVQLTWLFTTQPDLLRVGTAVEFPLALPSRVAPWRYEVVEQASIQLPFGEVQAYHLQPAAGLSQPGELSVEVWLAPQLQYLPVRIVVRQNAETRLELNLKSPPLQATP